MTANPVATDAERLSAVYEEHYTLLVRIAIGRFGIPEPEAETLAQDVFLDYVLRSETVRETRPWLVAAICNASRYYHRRAARTASLPDDFSEHPDPVSARVRQSLPDQLAGREAFTCLTARCQFVLRLRYFEGYSVPEIAEELRTSSKYAGKLLGNCLRQAQRRYGARA